MQDAECVALLRWALPRLGLRWPGFRKVRRQVCKRITRRIRELGLADVTTYRERLESVPEEWPELDALCRITISRFYRDRAVFDHLGTAGAGASADTASASKAGTARAVRQPPTLTADRLIKSRHRTLWSDQRAWISAI
jgi:chemotaxis protein methyltransferase CheR